MKLLSYLLLLIPAQLFALEMKIDVHARMGAAEIRDAAISLVVKVTNNDKEPITLGELNGDLINCEIELWFLGKGVKLRNKTDAEWRRKQAFIGSGATELMPGEFKQYTFVLKNLLPDDPDNDGFAKSLVQDVEHFKSGKGSVVLEYRSGGKAAETLVMRGSFTIKKKPE